MKLGSWVGNSIKSKRGKTCAVLRWKRRKIENCDTFTNQWAQLISNNSSSSFCFIQLELIFPEEEFMMARGCRSNNNAPRSRSEMKMEKQQRWTIWWFDDRRRWRVGHNGGALNQTLCLWRLRFNRRWEREREES